MTISSLPIVPGAAPSTAAAAAPSAKPAAAALFGQMVGQHLDAVPVPSTGAGETVPVVPRAEPATLVGLTAVPSAPVPAGLVAAAAGTDADDDPSAVDETVDSAGNGADPASAVPAPTAPDAAASGGLAGFPVVALLVASTTATPSPAGQSTQVGSVSGSPSPKDAGPETPGPGADAGVTPAAPKPADPSAPATSLTPVADASTTTAATTAVTTAPAAGATTAPTAAATSAPTAATPDPAAAGLTQVNGPVVGTTAAAGTPTTTAATRSAVLDQVLPTVPRIVLRGDGTSQMTLKLHPADLGEVHVTVTVRGHEVDVTLSAGAQAREALTEGSSRLRGLLEGIGHTAGQVVIRDLATSPGLPSSGTSAGTSTGTSTGDAGGGAAFGQPEDRASGQGQHRAPGLADTSPRGQRAVDPTHLRPSGTLRHQSSDLSGIDVTI